MKRWLLIAGRIIVGAVLIYAAYAKLRVSWLVFAGSLSGYKLLPDNLIEPIARTLPWFELAVGVFLITGIFARWFSVIATLLLGMFFAVMVRSYAAGLKIDCGCFGPGEALGPRTLLRDGSLLALSIAVTIGAFHARRRKPGIRVATTPAGDSSAVHAG